MNKLSLIRSERPISAVLCDVDGTLADNSHRQHWVRSKPKNWAAFNATMEQDKPISATIHTLKALKAAGFKIIIVTARTDDLKQITVDWLAEHDIIYDVMYMRKDKDYRDDSIVKSELLDQILAEQPAWYPEFVLDDRDRVVQMWRSRGIPCFQVAPGDF